MAQRRTMPVAAERPADDETPVILDLDPGIVAPSFIADRMEPIDESYRALVASIAAEGQIAPILVRPDPGRPGGYQVACGHRRLAAAAELGCLVRCIVRPLSDQGLVIAQGQENSARANLSFIERARFAQALEQRRYGRDVIMQALSLDKATVSRLLVVCRRLPPDVIEAVGPAPAAGRERWAKLASAFRRVAAERPINPLIETAAFMDAPTDQRFAMLYKHLFAATPRPHSAHERHRHEFRFGLSYATATVTDRAFMLRLDRALGSGFGAFLVTRLDGLFEDYSQSVRLRSKSEGPRVLHSLGR
ncbi:MAG: plasmid partitioning protein RepB [Proteobacteria bacterium]|nr:plasmid partitioning protein RepB [Pseudomonadota bacterium]